MPEVPARIVRHFKRKHYLAIQAEIREYVVTMPVESQEHILPLVKRLCGMFRREYPTFDETRFLRLCGLID